MEQKNVVAMLPHVIENLSYLQNKETDMLAYYLHHIADAIHHVISPESTMDMSKDDKYKFIEAMDELRDLLISLATTDKVLGTPGAKSAKGLIIYEGFSASAHGCIDTERVISLYEKAMDKGFWLEDDEDDDDPDDDEPEETGNEPEETETEKETEKENESENAVDVTDGETGE